MAGLGVMKCPGCGSRVFPTESDQCPACRSYTFGRVDQREATAPAPGRAPELDLYEVAILHWRLLSLIGGFFALWVLFAYARAGNELLNPAQVSPGDVEEGLRLASSVVTMFLAITSRQLATVLKLPGWFNVFQVAKESAAFFDDRNVPGNWLGPSLSALRPKEDDHERLP